MTRKTAAKTGWPAGASATQQALARSSSKPAGDATARAAGDAARDAGPVAEVAVAAPLRTALSYRIPLADADLVRRGTVVIVPLGAQLVTGYVLGTGGAAPAGVTLKPIRSVLEPGGAVPEEILQLAALAADYYMAPLGEVLRAALPNSRVMSRRRPQLTDAGRAALSHPGSALSEADRDVLLTLAPVPGSGKHAPGAASPARLRRLAAEGLVTFEASATPRARSSMSVLVEAVGELSVEERLERAGRRGNAARTRALLERLAGAPGPVPLDALRAELGPQATALVGRLEEKGLVQTVKVTRERDLDRDEAVSRRLSDLKLSGTQEAVVEELVRAQKRGGFAPFLLHGVTGSGKTLVYLACIDEALRLGRSAILLVPEIALTPMLLRELRGRYGNEVALLHSAIPAGERHDAWRRVRAGGARVVFGARSAVLAPARDLGLIVVDEEHDASYKQNERPHYHARDLAVLRAKQQGVPVLLGSATPSLESYRNVREGRYRLLELGERTAGQRLPRVEVVDLRDEFERTGAQAVLSERLREAVAERLERAEQTVLLLNRRGYANFLLCRECGARVECPNCSVCLSFHLRETRLRCHHCDYDRRAPQSCAKCSGTFLQLVGQGTEKVETIVRDAFPRARVARLDRDAVKGRDDVMDVLASFERGEIDILVGTQMVAKGHDFPRVTLVGVISVDAMLALPDFRATERAFALLTQVAGRAGRGELEGTVVLQTYHPENEAVRLACEQDYVRFYEREMRLRKLMRYPPSTHLVNLIARAAEEERAKALGEDVAKALRSARLAGIAVLGPALAPVQRIRREWRSQVLIKATSRPVLRELLRLCWDRLGPLVERGVLDVDVDPQDLL